MKPRKTGDKDTQLTVFASKQRSAYAYHGR